MRQYNIKEPENGLRPALQTKIENLNKPKGSLGRLEELAMQIGLVQQTTEPMLSHPCHLRVGGDHGIEHEGVSVSHREVTWQQMINFTQGGAGINMFCRQHGFKLLVVDSGVDYDLMPYPGIINRKIAHGTKNFLYEAAMTEEQMEHCMDDAGRLVDICNDEGCNVLSIGEMGIGNTSPSSVWMHLLGGVPLEQCVGAGAGLDNEGIRRKLVLLQQAVDNFRLHCPSNLSENDYVSLVASYFGGFEMVAAIGAMLRAAELHLIILVDGYIMSACMLAASRLYPSVLD